MLIKHISSQETSIRKVSRTKILPKRRERHLENAVLDIVDNCHFNMKD